jgi:hypothetical protein
MLTILDLIHPLEGPDFRIWRQTRTGLLSYPLDPEAARAHLAASVYLQMALKPHIIHVVGFVEAHHAATAEDVIASCKLARRAVENALRGAPDMSADQHILIRREELLAEAEVTLQAIQILGKDGVGDPLTDPENLTQAVTLGILDAPQLKNNAFARGQVITRIVNGACLAVDTLGRPLPEADRLTPINHR